MLLILKSVLKAREHSILHPERIFGNAEVSGNPSALHPHGPETGFETISLQLNDHTDRGVGGR